MKRELERAMRALRPGAESGDPAARARLEDALLAEFDRRHPVRRGSTRWLRGGLACAVGLVLVGFGAQAPADYSIDAGRRIELALGPGEAPPPRALLEATLGGGARRELRVKIRRAPDGAGSVQIDVWGDGLPSPESLQQRILSEWPGVVPAELAVLPIDGKVQDTIAGELRWELFRLGAGDGALHRARVELIERIQRAEGRDAQVEVKVDEQSGQRRVEVRVERRVLRR
jgi:hypothetical protein